MLVDFSILFLTIICVTSGVFVVFLTSFRILRRLDNNTVAIVVLGDITKSPRMMYHAASFASNGYLTYIIAFRGSQLPKTLQKENVKMVYLFTPLMFSTTLPRVLFLFFAPVKIILGALSLFCSLCTLDTSPGYILVQNPPAIPTLPITKLAQLILGGKIIIDWHNTGHSILSLRLGTSHPVVRLAKKIEYFFGRSAYLHIHVSKAMNKMFAKDLVPKGDIMVFHDRPPQAFHRLTSAERQTFREQFLSNVFDQQLPPHALLVSSTSWTLDEDFSILVDAARKYEEAAQLNSSLPSLVIIITGQGPEKDVFERHISSYDWSKVFIQTAWLAREDYPKLLGSADLGVSLHTSSSGVDLPMKVVDMFGCGLPVVSMNFNCLDELIHDGVNGHVFHDATGLFVLLTELFAYFPSNPQLKNLYTGLDKNNWEPWETRWNKQLLPKFRGT